MTSATAGGTMHRGIRLALAASLALSGGCSMGHQSNSSSGASSSAGDPLPTTNPPFQIASSDDLALWYVHVHQDYYGDPTHFGFWFSVHSTFATDVHNVGWKVERIDGPAQPAVTGTIANIPANNAGGDGHEHDVEWTEQAPGGQHQYRLTLDPAHTLTEASKQNNSYVFVVDVPTASTPSQAGDFEFYAREAHVHAMIPSNEYVFHFQARNRTAADIPATKWRLQDPLEGIDTTYDLDAIAQGMVGETDQVVHLLAPGMHDVTMTLDSANQVTETNEADNVRVFHLLISPPSGSG